MGTAPFIADYVVIIGGLIGLGYALWTRSDVLKEPATLILVAALLLLAATVPFVYRSEQDLLPFLACLPVLAAPGIAALIRPASAILRRHAVPALCLFGVATATALGLWEYVSTAIGRAGAGNNPIHFAGIATILGFLALMGVTSGRSYWRLIYLAGPVLAAVCVVISGSRGPLLAWAALAVISFPLVVIGLRSAWLAVAMTLAIAIGAVGLAVLTRDSLVIQRIVGALGQFTAAAPAEGSSWDVVRAFMQAQDPYRAAFVEATLRALSDAPLTGIGYGQMMPLAREMFPDLPELATLENFHSDLANFAVMAGVPGFVALLLLLLAPLFYTLRGQTAEALTLLLGAMVLSVGYVVLGLTNAMFGVLPQTALYAATLAYLIAFKRQARTAAST